MRVDGSSSAAGAVPLVNESCRRGEGRRRRCVCGRLLLLLLMLMLTLVLELWVVVGAMLVYNE